MRRSGYDHCTRGNLYGMTTFRKRDLYILFVAFVASECVFRLLVFIVSFKGQQVPPPPETLAAVRPICCALSALGLLAAVTWTLRVAKPSPNWPRFYTNVVFSLAFSEACTVFGMVLFFLGAHHGEFNRFAIASVAVDMIVILPQIIRRIL
jgi:hypothetical protein